MRMRGFTWVGQRREKGKEGSKRATRTGFSYRGFRFEHGMAEAQREERFIQSGNLSLVETVLKISTSVRKPRRVCRFGAECCKINVQLLLSGSIHPKVFIFRGPRISPAQIHTSTCGVSFPPSSEYVCMSTCERCSSSQP